MKRIAAILLVVLLIVSAASCGKKTETDKPTVQNQELDKQAFWDALAGVWAAEDDGTWVFVWFGSNEDGMYYTSGIMFSGAVRSGAVQDIEKTGEDTYKITVYYKAVPETMEAGSMPEMTKEYTFTMYPNDGYFTIDDIWLNNPPGKYEYKGKDLEEANKEVVI